MSKIIEGVFNRDKNIGNIKFDLVSLKKSICSKIFIISINIKKIINIFKKDLKKRRNKNLI